jgi:CheY-like chemotaxis protein
MRTKREKVLNTLVVDDSMINRTVLKKLLRNILRDRLGILHEADNGQAAVDLVLRENHVYDIIWMDMIMPVKDGLAACNEIKSVLPTTIVVMVSANDLSDTPNTGPLSPDASIIKPVKRALVEEMIERYFSAG